MANAAPPGSRNGKDKAAAGKAAAGKAAAGKAAADATAPQSARRSGAADGARALPDLGAGERAANFRHTREARRTEVTEDYVELIADLIDGGGEARAVDIAERLGVSHATVVKTITRLQQSGLVTSRPYRAIFLTDKGRQIAEASRRRHEIVVDFLRTIGVSEETAHADAEGMEHHCSSETLAAFARIIRRHGQP